MKKTLAVVGTMLVFAILGALLDAALGIQFPNFWPAAFHKAFYIVNGGVLGAVLIAKI